jgi:plastocyanin
MRTQWCRIAVAWLVAATALAWPTGGGGAAQSTGKITGRVEVRLPPSPLGTQPEVGSLAARSRRQAIDKRRSVVYLETAPRGAFEEPRGRRARIDQRDEAFDPHVLAITAGTTVDFPNNDTTYHNVFSLSPPRPFDLGRYAAGRSKSVTFDRPGLVRVFCDIHSHMSAFILVFSHRFFAVTDAQGRYAIPEVPPGSYTVSVWNEATKVESRNVTLPPGGGDVEVNFTLGQGAR